MISSIAVHNVEVVDLVKMMLCRVGCEDGRHAWVEATAEDGHEPLLLEAVVVCPLPAVLEVCLILRLVVRRVKIVHATLKASIHNRQILVGKSDINYNVRLEGLHQAHKLLYAVGIHLCCLNTVATYGTRNIITLRLRTACQHNLGKGTICCNFVCHYCSDATGTNN